MIVLTIAFRNLREHKAKTAIVGLLVAFAITLLVAGNSFMDSVTNGMRSSYAGNYTGDLIVHGLSEDSFSLIQTMPTAKALPLVPAYSLLNDAAKTAPGAAAVMPLLSGSASISIDEESAGMSFLWGVDFDGYAQMFPDSLTFITGGFPEIPGPFIILSEEVHLALQKETGRDIAVGDTVVLGEIGASGTRLREVTVAGVFRFERGGAQLDRVSIVDAATLRSLKGMSAVSRQEVGTYEATGAAMDAGTSAGAGVAVGNQATEDKPAGETVEALGGISEDELFGMDLMDISEADLAAATATDMDYDAILGDLSVRDKYAGTDSDAWHFLLVRLSDPGQYKAAETYLNAVITEAGLAAGISDWRWGAGMVAELAFYIQIIFNVIVLVISIVAVIIIMNTLVISVTERIPEIGTIRAIGGSKRFVRSMIAVETLTVSVIFGLVGMMAGAALIGLANMKGIRSGNMFAQLLFGGEVLRPLVSWSAVAISVAATAAIGTLASLYPSSVALRITPVQAMRKE
jgi:putative ABC transport system permease protein